MRRYLGATMNNEGIHPQQVTTAEGIVDDAIGRFGINEDIESLLRTINEAVLAITPTASQQSAMFFTIRRISGKLAAAKSTAKTVAISTTIRDIARDINLDIQGSQWVDRGAVVDQTSWERILDKASMKALYLEWGAFLLEKLHKMEYDMDTEDITEYWERFRTQIDSWPYEMRLDDRSMTEQFLRSMPAAIRAACRGAHRTYQQQNPEKNQYVGALEGCRDVFMKLQYSRTGGGVVATTRDKNGNADLVQALRMRRQRRGDINAMTMSDADLLEAYLEDGNHGDNHNSERETINMIQRVAKECTWCKTHRGKTMQHDVSECFHVDNPQSTIPVDLRQMFAKYKAVKLLCLMGSGSDMVNEKLQKDHQINPVKFNHLITQVKDIEGMENGRIKACGCPWGTTSDDTFNIDLARGCKANHTLTGIMRKLATDSGLGGWSRIGDNQAEINYFVALQEEYNAGS